MIKKNTKIESNVNHMNALVLHKVKLLNYHFNLTLTNEYFEVDVI